MKVYEDMADEIEEETGRDISGEELNEVNKFPSRWGFVTEYSVGEGYGGGYLIEIEQGIGMRRWFLQPCSVQWYRKRGRKPPYEKEIEKIEENK